MRIVNQKRHPEMLYVTRTGMEPEQREYGKTTTIYTSGCGLCAAIMVADRLLPSYDFELGDAIAMSYAVEANQNLGTNYKRFAPAFAKKFGLKWEPTSDLEELRKCLRTGGAAVVHVAGGLFASMGHYMVAINEEPDGRIAILDPSLTDTKYETPERREKVEVKNGGIILTDGATLDQECSTKEIRYHLFWRA